MVQKYKTVLTTGEVAKICCVAPRTVSKWFDAGKLRGYRIPGSKDRRIPIDQLIRFMRAHGIPLDGLESGETRLVVIDPDATYCDRMTHALVEAGGFAVRSAGTAFEGGALVQEVHPHIILVDIGMANIDPKSMVRWIRSTPELRAALLVGMGSGLTASAGESAIQDGFDGFLAKPFTIEALRRLIDDRRSPGDSDYFS